MKLISTFNRGPELLRYDGLISRINDILDDAMIGIITPVEALKAIDFCLYNKNMSTYHDYSFAKTDGKARRNFSSSDIMGKKVFFNDGKWEFV